ncbi:MAG TPA: hypothetical protein VF906_08620 [Candidatus Bathyarchaeia archaeon]
MPRLVRRSITAAFYGWRAYQVITALVASGVFVAATGSKWPGNMAAFIQAYLPNLAVSWPIIILLGIAIIGALAVYAFLHTIKLLIPVALFILGLGVSLQLITIPDIILKSSPSLQTHLIEAGAVVALMGALLLIVEYRR